MNGHGLATSITSSSSRTLASSAPAAVDAGTPGPHVADLEKQRAVAQPSPTADRPDAHSVWWDVLFIGTVVSGQLMGQGQIGVLMIPAEQLGAWLGATERGEWSWFAASYTLTLGLFVIVGGALGDIFGPKACFAAGYALMAVFNVGTGFCSSLVPFTVLRGLCGVGGALITPNAAALLGKQYPAHSHRRTVGFGVLGALAPIGFNVGAAMASLIVERLNAQWIFWIAAIACAAFGALGQLVLPGGGGDRRRPFDWGGAMLGTVGTVGMVLFNFSWNQGPLVGWNVPYVYALLAVGVVFLGAFVWWEGRIGERGLVPLSVFTKEVCLVLLALWWGWMSFGTFLYYTSAFIRDVRGFHQPLVITAELVTLVPFGAAAALAVIWLFPRVAGHWILAASLLAFFCGNLLMSLAPAEQTFWAMTFPAEAIIVLGPDLSYASGALIIANSVSRARQGVASGLTLLIVNYSMSIGLGMAGTVERYVGQGDTLKGYRAAFYFAASLAFLGFLLVVTFVHTTRGGLE